MKRGILSCPAGKRTCMLVPGILVAALMLAAMIVHMENAFMRLRAEPVFCLYPQVQTGQNAIFFPHAIQGTSLVAERLAAYDGPFLEDGSNDEVTGIAALVLHNRGTQPLKYIQIELQQGTRSLIFRAQTILPGDRVLILEANRQRYEQTPCQSCRGQIVQDKGILLDEADLQISISQINHITVTNTTDRPFKDIQLHHKGWLVEPGIFVGGITYTTIVGDLAPGQSVTVLAARFADGYSRIVQITCQ